MTTLSVISEFLKPRWVSIRRDPLKLSEQLALYNHRRLQRTEDVAEFLGERLRGEEVEVFCVLAVNARFDVIAACEIGRGSATECTLDLGAILRFGILVGAHGLILAHNHPSGSTSVSEADIEVTRRVEAAAEIVGLRLFDHVVVGGTAVSVLDDERYRRARG